MPAVFGKLAPHMPDRADWQLAIDIHPDRWCFPAGPSWIAGWLLSKTGRAAADVRAWIDDRPFLGLCGLPRPEIERPPPGREGPPHAGFSFLLEPPRGARGLRLDVCDQDGRWEEIHRQEITVAPDAAPALPAAPLGPAIGALLVQMLRDRRRQPQAAWAELAREALASHLAAPLNTLPNPPFFGALEEPTAVGRVRYGRLSVSGWLAHRERTVVGLTAWVDPLQPVPLLVGLPRRDVTGVFAGLRNAEHAQFAGHVDVPAALPHPVSLRLFAELDDGRRELVFTQRFRPHLVTGAEPLLPPLSLATFLRAAGALHVAAGRHRLAGGPWAARFAALRDAWSAWRAEAPLRRPAAIRRYAPPPAATAGGALRVVVVSHNLNLEGAPLFALEYARHLAAQPGWQVTVVSPEDGPLRTRFADAGLRVEIVSAGALLGARTTADFDAGVAALAAAPAWRKADLIVANTMVAFWAVHVARHLRRPSLLYLHESAAVRRFFEPLLAPGLFGRVEEAFGLADRVVFIAAATLAVHARLERRANFVLVPSWIDLARLRGFAAAHDRAELRRRHGFRDDELVVVNVGTVCERKGQHIFVRAIERLRRDLAAAGGTPPALRFLMVGARPGKYLDALRQEVALRRLAGVEFVDETPSADEFYHLGDVFVCSSFEESFPRVLMEAAAFRLPIVSTEVNGVTELLGPDDAWLVPPGDAVRLADAMRAALAARRAGDRTRAERAHAAVAARHDAARVLPLHAALAAATARPA